MPHPWPEADEVAWPKADEVAWPEADEVAWPKADETSWPVAAGVLPLSESAEVWPQLLPH